MALRTIQSPGVEIREKDLSLRTNLAGGTNIIVPGFSPQGPTGEPILITTISEFERTFGIPETPAEKYFYYSMKEVVNSNANVWAVRVPYGGLEGTGWSQSYSALFYPVLPSYTTTNEISGWVIQQPRNVSLDIDDYTELVRGNFLWGNLQSTTSTVTSYVDSPSSVTYSKETSADGLAFAIANDVDKKNIQFSFTYSSTEILTGVTFTFQLTSKVETLQTSFTVDDNTANLDGLFAKDESGTIYTNAGFFIVNTLQTSINEIGEGYYVGISTNDAANLVSSPNYDSISKLTSLNAISSSVVYGNYFNIPESRLDFSLSATKLQADSGKDSISESLEKVGFSAYDQPEYQDHLSVGVYRIRRSISDAGILSLAGAEQYLGSLDANRKKASPTGGVLENAFIEDIINGAEGSVTITVNPTISRFAWTEGSAIPNKGITVAPAAKGLFPVGNYAPNTLQIESSKQIGPVPAKLARALQLATNKETYTVDAIVDAGLSTIFAYTSKSVEGALGNFLDEQSPSLTDVDAGGATILENWKAVTNELIYFASGARKDCIAILDPLRSTFVLGKNTKVLDVQTNTFTEHVYNPLRECFSTINSNYATAYANWVKVYDAFSSRQIWIPFSGYAGAVIARSDATGNAWAAPAGYVRGAFSNVTDIAFNPSQKHRDRLYEIPINPIVYFAGEGYAVFGQKTLQNRPTALDRLNVRRLFLSLERSVEQSIRYFVFEPNTEFVRSRIVSTLSPAFAYAKNTEGLYDYLIVCDERNNTPENIDNGEIVVDIYIKPVKSAEFILVNFIATRTGQTFAEVL
jgi:hypothetical protein